MIQASLVTALLGFGLLRLMRRSQPTWWRVKAVRWALYAVAAASPLGSLLRFAGRSMQAPAVSAAGSLLAAAVILVLALYLSMPIASLARYAVKR